MNMTNNAGKSITISLTFLVIVSVLSITVAFSGAVAAEDTDLIDGETHWIGQTLNYTEDGANDTTLELYRSTDEGENLVTQLSADSNGTVSFETEGFQTGDYFIENDSSVEIVSFVLASQTFDVTESDADETDSVYSFDFESNRADFDVIIEEDDLNATEVSNLLDTSFTVELVEVGDEENEKTVVRGVGGGRSVAMNFSDDQKGTYNFTFTVLDTELTARSDNFFVEFDSDASVVFVKDFYREQAGDSTEIQIEFEKTNSAEFGFGTEENGYEASLRVTDGDGDGLANVTFDSYLAGDGDTTNTFGVNTSEDSISVISDAGTLSAPLEPLEYRLTAVPTGGNETDVATFVLEERVVNTVEVRSLPESESLSDFDSLDEYTNGLNNVAFGDKFVFVLDASGYEFLFDGATASELTEDAGYANSVGANILFEETTEGANQELVEFDASKGTVFTDAENDSYYVQYSTKDFPELEEDTNYTIGLNVTEDFPYAKSESDAESQSVSAQVTFSERELEYNTFNDDHGQINIEASSNYELSGTTTLAPNTELSLIARSVAPDSSYPFLYKETVTVSNTRTFSTELDFSGIEKGDTFTVETGEFETRDAGLTPTSFELDVRVDDVNGSVVDNATIRVDGEVFDSNSLLEEGTYVVEATAPNFSPASKEVTIDGEDERVNLIMKDKMKDVIINVVNENGELLTDARLTVGENSVAVGETTQIEEGSYTITAAAQGLESASRRVVINKETQTFKITLSEPTESNPNPVPTETETPEPTPDPGQPGFGLVVSILSLLGAYFLTRRKKA